MSLLKPTSFCGCMELASGLLIYASVMMVLTAIGLIMLWFGGILGENDNVLLTSIIIILFILANISLFHGAKTKDRKFVMVYIVMGFVYLVLNTIGLIITLIHLNILEFFSGFIFMLLLIYGQLCAISFYESLNPNSQSQNSAA